MQPVNRSILALDVGSRRVGIAMASSIARIAQPLKTIHNTAEIYSELAALIKGYNAEVVVVGLPRGLEGQKTDQTTKTQAFATTLKQYIDVPITLQDEAVTSLQAEAELNARHTGYAKSDIDALAATYILEDYLQAHQELIHG